MFVGIPNSRCFRGSLDDFLDFLSDIGRFFCQSPGQHEVEWVKSQDGNDGKIGAC